ncbi:MAG: site-specific integrase [Alphaproteobacteria bacterium]|nr:site-specific integrase [Alphaproteobacteria bacterium]
MEQQVDRRSLPYDPRKLDTITLGGLLEKYRDEVIPLKRCTDRETNLLNAFIVRSPKLAAMPLSAVSASHFCIYRDQRLKTVKPATICRELGLIQHAYDIAVKEWGYPLQENPVAKVKKPEIRNRRERRLSLSEIKSLIRALNKCQNKIIKPLTLFALQTGMRRSEILAAEWVHLSMDSYVLHIPVTKNGYPRTIPLTKRAVRILMEIKAKASDQGRIFPVTEAGFRMAWRRTIERSGLINFHFHDLRHEAISCFFEKGLSVPEVALISGHRDYRMLFRYTHLKAEDIANKLN